MASIQEKLADSLSVLKIYQDENNSDIIQGMKTAHPINQGENSLIL